MVQENPSVHSTALSTSASTTTNTLPPGDDHDKNYNPKDNFKSYPSDTVAAVTIAVLAVIVIITMLIVFRALRKRQRARRGERFGENVISTVTTGVMGTGGSAYATNVSNLNGVPTRGPVRWESINPAGDVSDADQGTSAPR